MSYPLRFKNPQDYPLIGKFIDKIDLKNAELPVRMYMKDEELQQEEVDLDVNDPNRYKKKKKYSYHTKSKLFIEDNLPKQSNGPNNGIQFEGQCCNLKTELTDEKTTEANRETKGPPFKFVLLQVVKKDNIGTIGGSNTEVNVIPVGEWYKFKKSNTVAEKFLEDIDDDFDKQVDEDKKKLARYRRLSKSSGLRNNDENENNDEDDSKGTNFFVSALFGKSSKSSNKKKGKVSNLDETGADMDVINQTEEDYGGDYQVKRADDEDDLVDTQVDLEDQEDVRAGKTYNNEEEDFDSSDDEEDEEDEEEKKELLLKEKEKAKGFAALDEGLIDSAKDLRTIINKAKEVTTSSSIQSLNDKRTRDDEKIGGGLDKRLKLEINETSQSKQEYELSDDGVSKYIQNMGGTVTRTEIMTVISNIFFYNYIFISIYFIIVLFKLL
jgi:hypothetical protein